MTAALNVLSLCSGIGGLELGLERAGMTTVGQVEIDPFARAVLEHHWPETPRHDDVRTTTDWWDSEPRPTVDLVAAGFPCQPVSLCGKGLAQDDPRWLWGAVRDVIAHLRPEWVVWENVPGLRNRGLDIVHADLVRLGYHHRVGRIRACEVGAPHPRSRLLGVAHAPSHRRRERRSRGSAGQAPHRRHLAPQGMDSQPALRAAGHWASEPRVDRLVDGLPRELVERRLRAYGNAVVPAVAEHVGRLIIASHLAAVAA